MCFDIVEYGGRIGFFIDVEADVKQVFPRFSEQRPRLQFGKVESIVGKDGEDFQQRTGFVFGRENQRHFVRGADVRAVLSA